MGMSDSRANLKIEGMLLDILTIKLSFLIAFHSVDSRVGAGMSTQYIILSFSFCIIFVVFMFAFRMYNMSTLCYLNRCIKSTLLSFAGTMCLVFLFLFMTYNTRFSRIFLFIFTLLSLALLVLQNLIYFKLRNKRAAKSNAIYVGNERTYNDIVGLSRISGYGFEVFGYVDTGAGSIEGVDCLGSIEDFEMILKKNPCEQVIFVQSLSGGANMEPYIEIANDMGLVSRVILDIYSLDSTNKFVSSIGSYPMITYHSVVLDRLALLVKRMIDIAGALVGIVISAPVLLASAIAIKLDSPGPVFFTQSRVGCNGKEFKIYKLRSMYIDAEKRKQDLLAHNQMDDCRIFKIKDDPRITRVGRAIRKASIDELPQFFNVLIGNMSLVGTRPPTIDEVALYDRRHWRRISIKPGITGIWQTNGRNDVTNFEEICQMDFTYIENWSLLLDAKLLFRTFKVLMDRKGAC